jgi:hypothetical protein
VELEVDYRAACPIPGHALACRYRVILGEDEAIECDASPADAAPLATVRVTLTDDWPELPAEARELLDRVSGLQFVRLPPVLRRDLDFIRSSGLSDCAGTAKLLCAEGARLGLRVRSS